MERSVVLSQSEASCLVNLLPIDLAIGEVDVSPCVGDKLGFHRLPWRRIHGDTPLHIDDMKGGSSIVYLDPSESTLIVGETVFKPKVGEMVFIPEDVFHASKSKGTKTLLGPFDPDGQPQNTQRQQTSQMRSAKGGGMGEPNGIMKTATNGDRAAMVFRWDWEEQGGVTGLKHENPFGVPVECAECFATRGYTGQGYTGQGYTGQGYATNGDGAAMVMINGDLLPIYQKVDGGVKGLNFSDGNFAPIGAPVGCAECFATYGPPQGYIGCDATIQHGGIDGSDVPKYIRDGNLVFGDKEEEDWDGWDNGDWRDISSEDNGAIVFKDLNGDYALELEPFACPGEEEDCGRYLADLDLDLMHAYKNNRTLSALVITLTIFLVILLAAATLAVIYA